MTFRTRQDLRNKIDRPAWISTGDGLPLLNCTVIDISNSGAKLLLEDADEITGNFSLWMSRRGHPRYACRVVWSGRNTIGVEFSAGSDGRCELVGK
jgi:PilZ domain